MAAPGDFQRGGSQGVLAPVAFDPSALAGAADAAAEQGARVGEVRFDDPLHAQQAVQQLDGSIMHGWRIKVSFHGMNNPNGTKLLITNCPPTCMWMDLKDHFKHLGNVAFAGMVGDKGKGKGKGESGYAAQPQQGMVPSQQLQPTPAQASASSGYVLLADGAPAAKRPRTDQFGNVILDGLPGTTTGEVRYAEAEAAAQASVVLCGTELGGRPITVELDLQDRTRLIVSGIPDGLSWADLKGHFESVGTVVFADVGPSVGPVPAAPQFLQAPPAPAPPGGCVQAGACQVPQPPPQVPQPLQALQELAAAAGAPLQAVGSLPIPPPPPPVAVAVAAAPAAVEHVATATATVRYETSEEAQQAVSTLDQLDLQDFGGGTLTVVSDASARDGTKIRMTGLPAHIEWQDVKDFCSQIGKIAFCEVIKPPPSPLEQLAQLAQQPVQVVGQPAALQLVGGFPQQPMLLQQIGGCSAPDGGGGLLPEGDGKGKGKRRRPPQYGADGKLCGEVRYESPEHAQQAIAALHGSILGGEQIKVLKHGMNNPLGTKLLICGVSPATTWRELKEHFLPIGPIAYANC